MQLDTPVILGARDRYEVTNMKELLPRTFTEKDM
jgi:cytidine deaminase